MTLRMVPEKELQKCPLCGKWVEIPVITAVMPPQLTACGDCAKAGPVAVVDNIELDSVSPDTLVKIEDIEPDSEAFRLNFRGRGPNRYIRQSRYLVPLFPPSKVAKECEHNVCRDRCEFAPGGFYHGREFGLPYQPSRVEKGADKDAMAFGVIGTLDTLKSQRPRDIPFDEKKCGSCGAEQLVPAPKGYQAFFCPKCPELNKPAPDTSHVVDLSQIYPKIEKEVMELEIEGMKLPPAGGREIVLPRPVKRTFAVLVGPKADDRTSDWELFQDRRLKLRPGGQPIRDGKPFHIIWQ